MKKIIFGLCIATMLNQWTFAGQSVKLTEYKSKEEAVEAITGDIEYEYELNNVYTIKRTNLQNQKTMTRDMMQLTFNDLQCFLNVDYQEETGTIMLVEVQYYASSEDTEEIKGLHEECINTFSAMVTEYSGEKTVDKLLGLLDTTDYDIYKQYTINQSVGSKSSTHTYSFINEEVDGYQFLVDSVFVESSESEYTYVRMTLKPAKVEDITK